MGDKTARLGSKVLRPSLTAPYEHLRAQQRTTEKKRDVGRDTKTEYILYGAQSKTNR